MFHEVVMIVVVASFALCQFYLLIAFLSSADLQGFQDFQVAILSFRQTFPRFAVWLNFITIFFNIIALLIIFYVVIVWLINRIGKFVRKHWLITYLLVTLSIFAYAYSFKSKIFSPTHVNLMKKSVQQLKPYSYKQVVQLGYGFAWVRMTLIQIQEQLQHVFG